ncbi:MAG: hypothetical protein ACRDKT_09925 [Actinomycetota bacterium]
MNGSFSSDDVIVGDDGDNAINGFGGTDTLTGTGGNDELVAYDGSGGILDGGAGRDLVLFDSGPVEVDLAAGNATGGTGTDSLIAIEDVRGSPSTDVIRGDEGPNHLIGADQNDRLFGRGGDDVLDGGTDRDPRPRGERDLADGGDDADVCRRAGEKIGCEA